QGGMSNMRILHAATVNTANTLGVERQIGSLEVGKLADLIVLDRNPLEDIHNTNSVRYTMVNGRLYDSLSMDEIGNYSRPRDHVWVSNVDGSDAHPITAETVNSLTGPTWEPNGAFIAAARLFSTDDRLHASELRLFDLAGGSGRVLVPAPANGENVHEPQFSR